MKWRRLIQELEVQEERETSYEEATTCSNVEYIIGTTYRHKTHDVTNEKSEDWRTCIE